MEVLGVAKMSYRDVFLRKYDGFLSVSTFWEKRRLILQLVL